MHVVLINTNRLLLNAFVNEFKCHVNKSNFKLNKMFLIFKLYETKKM